MLLKFLTILIKRNPAKVIFLLIALGCFPFAGTISDSVDEYQIVKVDTLKMGTASKYCYITSSFNLKVYDSKN